MRRLVHAATACARAAMLASALVAMACGGGDNPAAPSSSGAGGSGAAGGGGATNSARTLTASIDGASYSVAAVGTRSGTTGNAPAGLFVAGSNVTVGTGTTLGFGVPLSTGTFSFAPGSVTNANLAVVGGSAPGGWLAFRDAGQRNVDRVVAHRDRRERHLLVRDGLALASASEERDERHIQRDVLIVRPTRVRSDAGCRARAGSRGTRRCEPPRARASRTDPRA
jgi:hypothetical protein